MTDQQLLTLALSLIIPISFLIYSNSRISDTRDALNRSVVETKDTLRAEIAAVRAEMNALRTEMRGGFERIELLLKVHELEHHK